MRVTLERDALVKSLSHLHRVVERRNTIPILGNILLRATKNQIELKATDLDIEITETLTCDVQEDGATTIPAHLFYDIVRKLQDGAHISLDLGADQGSLSLKAGRSRFQLQILPEADFPDLSAGEFPFKFTLPAESLKKLINKTQFAISTEETRYYLNGIYLHPFTNGKTELLRAVATDGHRLALIEMPAPENTKDMPGIIIPRKTVSELQRLLDDITGDVTIQVSSSKIRFTLGPVILTSKLIDGTFPDYARVIPANNDKELDVNCLLFSQAVDRVSTISSERGRAVKLTINDGKVTFTVTNPDSGLATEEIEAKYDSGALDIGFNSRYLLDIAERIDSDNVTFKLSDPGSPTLIQDNAEQNALYVLMPMRV
ncbi:MAG: DNA polymerase III subunit beta [Pseudomonadota bacterium]